MEKSPTITELSKALTAFQKDIGAISKDSENPFFKSKYASLENIIEKIKTPLAQAGLSFSQFPSGVNQLTTILMHISGEYLMAPATMAPKENSPQAQGSAITYMRRYALSAILGLATEEDDDGNQATAVKPTVVKNAKEGGMDIFSRSVKAIEDAKSVSALATLGEKIDKSAKLSDTQKDNLDKMIGQRMSELENVTVSHVE